MGFCLFDTSVNRQLQTANFITYRQGAVHPDRVLRCHDIVIVIEGSWEIYEGGIPYSACAGDVILLAAGNHHGGVNPCAPGTRTIYIHVYPHPGDRFVKDPSEAINLPERMIAVPTPTPASAIPRAKPRCRSNHEEITFEYGPGF